MPIIKAHLQGLDKVMQQQQQQQQPGSEPEPRSGRGRGSGGSSGSGPVLLADISMGTANGLAAVRARRHHACRAESHVRHTDQPAGQPQTNSPSIPFEDRLKGGGAQIIRRKSRSLYRFPFAKSPAIHGANEVVQQALASGGIVKKVASTCFATRS